MSDYEGGWDSNDWEEVKSPPNKIELVATVPPEPITRNYIGRPNTKALATSQGKEKAQKSKSATSVVLPSTYRPYLQGPKHNTTRTQNGGKENMEVNRRKSPQAQVVELPAFQRFLTNRNKPDLTVGTTHSFREIARSLPRQLDSNEHENVANELARICISTNSFIEVPLPDSSEIKIWGTPEETRAAEIELSSWESVYMAPGLRNHRAADSAWPRMGAFDGRKEERLIRQSLADDQHRIFQQYADLPFEAHLIWPDDYDLEYFQDTYDTPVLKELQINYDCRIIHSKDDPRATVIACSNDTNLHQVYTRLLGLVKEMMSKKRGSLSGVQCRLPTAQNFKDQVSMTSGKVIWVDGHQYRFPQLLGQPLPIEEVDHWTELSLMVHRRYRRATKMALISCIKSMHFSQKHVRMRVSFGGVALGKHQKPPNGATTYIIDKEFIEMIRKPGVELKQFPVATGPGFELIDRIDRLSDFGTPELSWIVHFDFEGEHNSTLRLEKEYTPNYLDADEPNVSATRWVVIGSSSSLEIDDLLDIHQVDIDKIGHRIFIASRGVFHNRKVRQDLQVFERGIRFRPSLGGQRFMPSKHARFVQGHTGLRQVHEITVAKYQFKDTKGTFEVRRTDHFPQNLGPSIAIPSSTDWLVTYYYADWDSLLAQLADIEPGQDVDWARDLSTFFPKIIDRDRPKSLPDGYKNFMNEVDEIRDILNRVTADIPGSMTESFQ